jgi:hypothetical protein
VVGWLVSVSNRVLVLIYGLNWLIVQWYQCAYCAVGAGFLNIAKVKFILHNFVPRLMWLVVGLLARGRGCDSATYLVRSVMDEMALSDFFLVFRFSTVTIMSPMLRTTRIRRTSGPSLGSKGKPSAFHILL